MTEAAAGPARKEGLGRGIVAMNLILGMSRWEAAGLRKPSFTVVDQAPPWSMRSFPLPGSPKRPTKPPGPAWRQLLGRNRPGKPFPFRTSPELVKAISKAHLSLASILSCPHPPFWDDCTGWKECFEDQVQRLVRLQSVECLEACEHLEDLLAALQDRRAEVLRVTIYQILYELPPLRRRNRWGDLGMIDLGLVRTALSRVSPGRLQAALAEPGWPPLAKTWVLEVLRLALVEGEQAADRARGGRGIRGDTLGPGSLEVLGEVLKEVAAAPCLLPLPRFLAGCSCFDLRIEHLSNLAADHLAQWPVREDLLTALAGCSEENRRRVLARAAANSGQALVDPFEQISLVTPWRQVVLAQRRLTWWLKAVDFHPRLLAWYDTLRKASATEAEEIGSKTGIPAHALAGIAAMVRVYPGAGAGLSDACGADPT